MAELADYKPVSAANNDPPPAGAPEGQDRDDVNNIQREQMGVMRRDWEGTATDGGEWRNVSKGKTVTFVSATSFIVSAFDGTPFFPVGRKLKVTHTAGNPVYCFVTSVVFNDPDTTVVVEDFDDAAPDDAIRAGIDKVEFHAGFGGTAGHGLARGAYEGVGGQFVIPLVNTGTGINAAITLAATEGKIVLLKGVEYDIDTTVLIASGSSLLGAGSGQTILKAKTNLDAPVVDLADKNEVTLRGFEIDGNAANQSGGADTHGLEAAGGNLGVSLIDLEVHDTYRKGIHFGQAAASDNVYFFGVVVKTCGEECILIEDAGTQKRVILSGITATDPGTGGVALATADAIKVMGTAALTGIDVELNVAAGRTGAGIRFDQTDVGGTPSKGALHATLTGFSIVGTGAAVAGLFLGGTRCRVGDGIVELTGGTAQPLVVDGRGGGAEQATDNGISNVIFDGGQNNLIAVDAVRTQLHGCVFRDQSANGLDVAGNGTLVSNCEVDGSGGDGISLASPSNCDIQGGTIKNIADDGILVSGADDSHIQGVSLRDIGGDGIQVLTGSNRSVIKDNLLDTITGVGIKVDAGAVDTRTAHNAFVAVSGADYTDAGTTSLNTPIVDSTFFQKTGGDQAMPNSLTDVTGLTLLSFPGGGGNGSRKFLIQANLDGEGNGASDFVCTLHMGATGDKTDAVIRRMENDTNNKRTFDMVHEVTPASGDKFGFATNAGNSGNTIYGAGVAGRLSSVYCTKVADG